ncbi:hypothetical protein TCSYLVIO_004609 [Trypanosoma cruzi]|uniref:Spindle assembly abnormal protein 6 N-terminal domain-containing protein n=3 Tax=Trypanosoma cruzi TaxID=5693 RepID=Q4E121_TRYCC|nr:hypothetical protein, conserved [Trypanosoma cruzi]EAN98497.1 hypothetical protein, conserved [Trypanosoma cruzi]EKG04340.1 hypothetical protein TCSYLVIO_004609 [Trypanosoma cruzi]KAF5226312.1 hypothetical protein ECC02_000435 [Trypanosoma cruzi]KAF8291140.1 hypothetical protein TcYC6_0121570 [Trypanosoma cruzi]PWV08323.1 hypothetical protein C3747_91g73 [Trypanosoma cruzi]|eukprot:XP_820348.1 hypothetical protein [Trypanosoma cruzi strain CL Brener]
MGDSLIAQLEQDFRAIEQSDPSLTDGFKIVYDREVPCELRPMRGGNAEPGSLEGMKVKVLSFGDDHSLSTMRVEITSESDLFFHYTCVINHAGFIRLREHQSLVCDFPDFLMTLLKMFNRCIKEPQRFLVVLLLDENGTANMEFIENLEYKLVGVLTLPFRASPPEVVREQIGYRYSAVRARLALLTAQLKNSNLVLKPRQ